MLRTLGLSVLLLVAGCFNPTTVRTGVAYVDLRSPDPLVVIAATRGVAAKKNMEAVPYLIENLRSTDAAVRMWSILALTKFTGGDRYGYVSWGTLGDREAAVERWEHWLEQRRSGLLHTGG